jgi:drug/metabolite transporter (DMT)-like permease
LVSSFSGVIAIIYGILFLKEPADLITYLAFALVFLSVFMMNYQKDTEKKEKKKISVKWLISVTVVVISNGLIAVISRAQQIRFEHAYDNEFMILSLGGACIGLFILGIVLERGKFQLGKVLKYGGIYGMAAGLLNGAQNLFNLYLLLYIPLSIATSLKTGISIIVSFAVSCLIYKEKFTLQQLISAIVGMVALLLLNF